MCIAIFKKKGVDLPTDEVLQNCWTANDDGAGYAFAYGGRVYIKKGFMTFDTFMDSFKFNDQKFNFKKCGMLIHFRISTHGAKDGTMTHPFPIQADDGALCKPEYVSDYAVIHNGIISLTTSEATKNLSDTAVFVKEYLTLIGQNRGWFNKQCNLELIEKLIGSNKMAILNNKGEIMFTRGFVEDKGIFYSNTTYKDIYMRVSKVTNYKGSEYDIENNYYDDGYDWTRKHNLTTSKYNNKVISTYSGKSIGLMRANIGDTVEYDGMTQLIDSSIAETYWVDKEGALWITDGIKNIPATKVVESEDSYCNYYLLGSDAKVYDSAIAVRLFVADKWAFPDQFPEL